MLVCLSLNLLDGCCHLIAYGLFFIKRWMAVLELFAVIAAVVLLAFKLQHQTIKPHGVVRVLVIGVIYRKLSVLHIYRSNRRHLSRMKSSKRFFVKTPLETVMNTLHSLVERIPNHEVALLTEINTTIQIITKGTLYDAVDVND
jgi:hypothetical protein